MRKYEAKPKSTVTAASKGYDAQGLKRAIYRLFDVALSRSEFNDYDFEIRKIVVKKEKRPVWYFVYVEFKLLGDLVCTDEDDSFTETFTIGGVPTNQDIPENYYIDVDNRVDNLIECFQRNYMLPDEYRDLEKRWDQSISQFEDICRYVERKFSVKLNLSWYPNRPNENTDGLARKIISFYAKLVDIPVPSPVKYSLGKYDHAELTIGNKGVRQYIREFSGQYKISSDMKPLQDKLMDYVENTVDSVNKTAEFFIHKSDHENQISEYIDRLYDRLEGKFDEVSISYRIDSKNQTGELKIECGPDTTVTSGLFKLPLSPEDERRITKSIVGKLNRRLKSTKETPRFSNFSQDLATL